LCLLGFGRAARFRVGRAWTFALARRSAAGRVETKACRTGRRTFAVLAARWDGEATGFFAGQSRADSWSNGTLVSSTIEGRAGTGSRWTTGSPALSQSHAEPVTDTAATATFAATARTMSRRPIIALPQRAAAADTATPPESVLAHVVQAGTFGAVVHARPAHHANLESANVELPPAVAASRDANAVAGRHDAVAASRSATTTVFLPSALAR
jgi:hypothetical protein